MRYAVKLTDTNERLIFALNCRISTNQAQRPKLNYSLVPQALLKFVLWDKRRGGFSRTFSKKMQNVCGRLQF